ncbi:MAG: hypothetical protein HY040_12610 [Planctomycetes bacterium]|nr:hypothetical protein [Planctomycetota bacterium]
MSDFLTFYLPILVTVALAGGIAVAAKERMEAFWRGLFGCIILLGSYEFIKQLIEAANHPDPKESDFLWAGLNGIKIGLLMGGLVGLAVGYAARLLVTEKRK